MGSELVAILEKESAAEIERVLAEAQARAAQLEAEAAQAAAAYLEAQRARLEAERKMALAKAQSGAQVQSAALVLRAKDQAVAEVFARAEQELARLQQDRERYTRALRGLIREAAGGLSGRLIVEVHPQDREMAAPLVRELGLDAELRTADDVRGGVRVSSQDRRFIVENTLASRVDRVRPVLVTDVARLLWG